MMENEIRELAEEVRTLVRRVERLEMNNGTKANEELTKELRKLNATVDRINMAIVGNKESGIQGIVHTLNEYGNRLTKIEMAGIAVGILLLVALAEKAWPLIMKIFT